jgi:hypothetical protein
MCQRDYWIIRFVSPKLSDYLATGPKDQRGGITNKPVLGGVQRLTNACRRFLRRLSQGNVDMRANQLTKVI